MLWIPELPDTRIGNAAKNGAAGRAPVGGENGFPNDENTKTGIAFALE